jgi:hypothetical protein
MNSTVESEASYLFNCMFPGRISGTTLKRYALAYREVFAGQDTNEAEMGVIIEKALDAESIEIALRLIHKKRYLTKRLQILFSLVEAENRHFELLFNTGNKKGVIVGLVLSVISSAMKTVKGLYLVRRYRLA